MITDREIPPILVVAVMSLEGLERIGELAPIVQLLHPRLAGGEAGL